MIKIGVTERGDGGLDLSWRHKLCPANIIITKNITGSKFKELLCEHQDKIILHMGCTGRGSSKVEPNVPHYAKTYNSLLELLQMGFPVSHVVLRLDPIIPNDNGIEYMANVLGLFRTSGITRVRYSFMDMYNHVKIRFTHAGIPIPYDTFHAPVALREKALRVMSQYQDDYSFEACAEPLISSFPFVSNTGCVSKNDLAILGLNSDENAAGHQRTLCHCLNGKTELLTNPRPCPHGCLFCYWQDRKTALITDPKIKSHELDGEALYRRY